MNIIKNEWDSSEIDSDTEAAIEVMPNIGQPGFGIAIYWNEPRKFWKPFVCVNFFNRVIQFGWLY